MSMEENKSIVEIKKYPTNTIAIAIGKREARSHILDIRRSVSFCIRTSLFKL